METRKHSNKQQLTSGPIGIDPFWRPFSSHINWFRRCRTNWPSIHRSMSSPDQEPSCRFYLKEKDKHRITGSLTHFISSICVQFIITWLQFRCELSFGNIKDANKTGGKAKRNFTHRRFASTTRTDIIQLALFHTLQYVGIFHIIRAQQFEAMFLVYLQKCICGGDNLKVDQLIGNVRVRTLGMEFWKTMPLCVFARWHNFVRHLAKRLRLNS